jgi:hypothetical protein
LVMWMCERAEDSSLAISGSASAPSIKISMALPGRGGGWPMAQADPLASSACSQPIRRSRRRW